MGERRARRCLGCGGRFTTREEPIGRPARRLAGDWTDSLPTMDELAELIEGTYRRGPG
jgi:hypothetical protein